MAIFKQASDIGDFLHDMSEAQQYDYLEGVRETLNGEGVIIISGPDPDCNSNGMVTNVDYSYPTFESDEEFLDYLDKAMSSYWVPKVEEEKACVEGPFKREDASNARQILIDEGVAPGNVFYAKNEDDAKSSAAMYL